MVCGLENHKTFPNSLNFTVNILTFEVLNHRNWDFDIVSTTF